MAEIRLSKLTEQFSIALSRLVDFLNENGANVEINPNAKVSDEFLPAIEAKFGDDQKLKEDSAKVSIRLNELIETLSKKNREKECFTNISSRRRIYTIHFTEWNGIHKTYRTTASSKREAEENFWDSGMKAGTFINSID